MKSPHYRHSSHNWHSREWCSRLMPLAPKKTAQVILDSGNDYLGALKGNQSGLLSAVQTNFQPQQTVQQLNKGHGRIEKRTISISHQLDGIPAFPGLRTLIRVESERQVHRATIIEVSHETRPDRCLLYRYRTSFC